MDFQNGTTLLTLCQEKQLPISEVMRQRELNLGALTSDTITSKLHVAFEIMNNAVHTPLTTYLPSMGGLIGGEAKKIMTHASSSNCVCGSLLSKALSYAMAVIEVNASMGLIVAAPTAGSSGVLPGMLFAIMEEHALSEDQFHTGLLNASAIGYLLMRNASVSGAEAGCQAEVGSASAMAASALVELMGGTPQMCFEAASLALSNLLGLVCDPIAGLVESPCQSRNAIGVTNALTSAELALSGITHPIPFDEMTTAMYRVGRSMPFELRETALGGSAATPTGCSLNCSICTK